MLNIDLVEASIIGEEYFYSGLTTICWLKHENGYETVGSSCPVHVEDYKEEVGKQWARKDAFNKMCAGAAMLEKQAQYDHEHGNG